MPDSECLSSSGVTTCESDLHLSGFQVPTEAGRPYKFASSTSLFTPLVAWATRACLFATCPSYCRPCWTSCLIKVSSARSYYNCSTQLWKQTNIQHHSLCRCGIIFILTVIVFFVAQSRYSVVRRATLCSDHKSCAARFFFFSFLSINAVRQTVHWLQNRGRHNPWLL